MSDLDRLSGQLTGTWVEIQEQSNSEHTVLRRPDADIPPTRGGRRQLKIAGEGAVHTMAQGASDRMEPKASGGWQLTQDHLELNLDGWEGEYVIESITDTELILHRR